MTRLDLEPGSRGCELLPPGGLLTALDEVQRIRNWSGLVKGLWDGDSRTGCPLRVVILGSAPWAMLTGIHESLAGRFDLFPVMHWSLEDMQRAFGVTLDEYIFFGGYPEAAIHIRVAARWRGHISIFHLARQARAIAATLSVVTLRLVKNELW